METIYKILENCEVKKVGERQYEFIASTADIDRDGEVIDVNGWDLKNFKKNPVIMFAHDYRTLPIGRASRIGVRGGMLVNTVEFPPEGTYEFADIVERLVGTGFLKTESVGFMPKKWEDGDVDEEGHDGKKPRRTYVKQELLEISIVPVPSNPNALMNAVKEGVITTKQLDVICPKTPANIPFVDPAEDINTPLDELTKPEHKEEDVSQGEILDELDYIIRLIDTQGMNDDVIKDAWNLVRQVVRLAGSDIPVDIKELFATKPVETPPVVEESLTYADVLAAIKAIAKT